MVGLAFHASSINDVILSPISPQGIISEVIWDQRWSRSSFGVSAGHNNVEEERLENLKYQTQTLLLSSLCSPSRSLNTELPVGTTPGPLLLEPSRTPDTAPSASLQGTTNTQTHPSPAPATLRAPPIAPCEHSAIGFVIANQLFNSNFMRLEGFWRVFFFFY